MEITRAIAAENSVIASVAAERTRALGAEAVVSMSVLMEASRAAGVESSLAVAIASLVAVEASRAVGVELSISSRLQAEITRALGAEASVGAAEMQRAMAAEGSIAAVVPVLVSTRIASISATSIGAAQRVTVWSTRTAGSYNLISITDTARWTTGQPAVGVWTCLLRSDNGAHWMGYVFTLSVSFYFCNSAYSPFNGGHCSSIYNSYVANASPSGCGTSITSWGGTGAFSFDPGACVQTITLTCTSLG